MEYKIPEEIVEEVRLRTDIVEIISEHVGLQRKGKNYLGLCPFHSEKTPSFTVTPEKQMFYCFGCHAGGNVFSFLMKKENWNFVETVRYLAQKQGINLPEKELSPREKAHQTRRRRWEEIHDWATGYFHEVLIQKPEGEPGREYFRRRGIELETIKEFRLGYAPDRWDGLLQALQTRGISPEELAQAGLVIERDGRGGATGYYDRFRNRVIFAILDSRQKTIGFGGRVLDNSTPKYLNSPETEFFNKGHHLYGMHRAYQGIRQHGFALLAEGYMDVIALQKNGFHNAVASLGTALTREQGRLLKRYTDHVIIVFDSDQAGIQAALRSGEILRDMGFRVDVLNLPDAKDPDEFLRTSGVEVFRDSLAKAQPYVQFKYYTIIRSKPNLKDPLRASVPDKAELVRELAPDILKVSDPVEREGYERFLSLELGLSLENIQRGILDKRPETSENPGKPEKNLQKQDKSARKRDNISRCANKAQNEPAVIDGGYRAERIILRLLLEGLIPVSYLDDFDDGLWKDPLHKEIYNHLKNNQYTVNGALPNMESDTLESKAAQIMLEEMDTSKPERLFQDCLKRIQSQKKEATIEELEARIIELEKSGDLTGAMALLEEIGERLKSGEK